jgi:hypothetical protein
MLLREAFACMQTAEKEAKPARMVVRLLYEIIQLLQTTNERARQLSALTLPGTRTTSKVDTGASTGWIAGTRGITMQCHASCRATQRRQRHAVPVAMI